MTSSTIHIMRTGPETPAMLGFGVDWVNIVDWGNHLVNLLETQGEHAVDLVKTGLKLLQAVTNRDFANIFQLIRQEVTNISVIITAIKQEFGLN